MLSFLCRALPGAGLLLPFPYALLAQTADSTGAARRFELGVVEVIGRRDTDTVGFAQNRLTALDFTRHQRLEVGRALNLLPGVALASTGPRNESIVYLRGFDLRQIPVFLDGVPVYVPYDGYVDLARFTTADLAEIRVEKGFASLLYGPNALGGAINLVSRAPAKPLEYSAAAGTFSGRGANLSVNVGARRGKFYAQASAARLRQEYYPLSADFADTRREKGDRRDNADRADTRFSGKIGFQPRPGDEYTVGYAIQQGRKGQPVYTGADPAFSRPRVRYWRWPKWDKETVYFLSRTSQANGAAYFKTRVYFDRFANVLDAFDDSTYTSQARPFAFRSYYRAYTAGGSAEAGLTTLAGHTPRLAVHYKYDRHREWNRGEPPRQFADVTTSAALEDVWQLTSRWRLAAGLSYDWRASHGAQDYNSTTREITDFAANDNAAFNLQGGVFYTPTAVGQLRASAARKTRFATLKDRYSYRLGQALPNPDLRAETAQNYELGYTRTPGKAQLGVQASVFYSRLDDVIQQVNNVQGQLFQLQNTGRARYYGGEIALNQQLTSALRAEANYTYLRRENQTNPELRFIDTPAHKVFGSVQYAPWDRLSLLGSGEWNSDRYSTSGGLRVGGFAVFNASARLRLIEGLTLEGGVNNVLDRNYALFEGFPEAGCNFFVNLRYQSR
ncbi:TonB-dependent receptor plug domain-containing protein [Hymenobacter sp. B81]|uniref:TonB-dependent receptor plug domain-containing protein n=1 Tax=Hymenobacter sp. B81 TaxID=3344878 RepID=UPI0037DBF7BC